MRKKYKFISIFAIAVLLLTMCLAVACNADKESDIVRYEDLTNQGYELKATSDTTMSITKYSGTETRVEIPSKVLLENKEYTIIEIGDSAFEANSDITGIVLPDTISIIGDSAFAGTSILSFVMPNSVITVGDKCFLNCASLKTIVLSENLLNIGEAMFKNCPELKDLTIPDSVSDVGKSFIESCNALETLYIGQNVKTIYPGAMNDNSGLKYVYIDSQKVAENEQYMERLAFYFDRDLGSISFTTNMKAVYILNTIEIKSSMNMGGMTKQEKTSTYGGKTYDVYKKLA